MSIDTKTLELSHDSRGDGDTVLLDIPSATKNNYLPYSLVLKNYVCGMGSNYLELIDGSKGETIINIHFSGMTYPGIGKCIQLFGYVNPKQRLQLKVSCKSINVQVVYRKIESYPKTILWVNPADKKENGKVAKFNLSTPVREIQVMVDSNNSTTHQRSLVFRSSNNVIDRPTFIDSPQVFKLLEGAVSDKFYTVASDGEFSGAFELICPEDVTLVTIHGY